MRSVELQVLVRLDSLCMQLCVISMANLTGLARASREHFEICMLATGHRLFHRYLLQTSCKHRPREESMIPFELNAALI